MAALRMLFWVAGVSLLSWHPAWTQAVPVPRTGQCGSGYFQSGAFCVPMSNQRCRAIPKPPTGQCPSGWANSGRYCVEFGNCQRSR